MAKILRSFDENGNPLKQCTKCKQWKSADSSNFTQDKNRDDGLYPQCKQCRKESNKRPKKTAEIVDNPTKTCTGPCGRTLPATTEFFCKSKGGKYGLHSRCKACKYSLQKNPPEKPTLPDGYKQCSGPCGKILPATTEFFYRNQRAKNGIQSWCKQCSKENDKNHRDERAEIRRQEREEYQECLISQMNPQFSSYDGPIKQCTGPCGRVLPATTEFFHKGSNDKLSAKCKECYNTKRRADYQEDEVRTKKKVYREEHRDERNEKKSIYYQTPRGRVLKKASHHRRRARKRNAEGTYTAEQLQDQLKRQKGRCYYAACGHAKFEKRDGRYVYHVDHIVPLSKGGSNNIDNIVLACPTCNMSKNDRLPSEWVAGGRLI